MIKGIIFDMDGVIIDSLSFFYDSFEKMIWEEYAVKVTKDEFGMVLGAKAEHAFENILDKKGLEGDGLELKKKWEVFSKSHTDLSKIRLKPGVKEFLPLASKNFGVAVATGNVEEFAKMMLKKNKVIGYFPYIITADHVKMAKPNPEVFLKAAEKLNLIPSECVVIEDALLGIQAAKRAGMYAISIKDDFTRNQDHSIADLQLDSMNDLKISMIKQLGG